MLGAYLSICSIQPNSFRLNFSLFQQDSYMPGPGVSFALHLVAQVSSRSSAPGRWGEKGLIAPCYLWNYTSIKHVEPQNFHGQTLDNSHWNSTYSKFCLSKLSLYHRHNRSLEELTNELVIILDFLWRVVTCRRTGHMMGSLLSACVGWKYQKSWSSRLRLEQLTTFIHASLSKDVFLMKI